MVMNSSFAFSVSVGCLAILVCPASLRAELPARAFPREEIHVADVGPDEAVANLRIANNRWVDCFDDATAIHDIFRIEGVLDKGDQEKALALWKWFRILVSATCGGYCYETGKAGQEGIVFDPHKIFTVYGHHQCDGQSWTMVALWRAAGYMALDECHSGHTIASLRYQDADGPYRFHDLDPQHRFYYWDPGKSIVGTWTMPLLRGLVHRHVLAPQQVHDLRRSLRIGESVELLWNNQGHVVPPNKQQKTLHLLPDYVYSPGRTNGVYAAVGQETQTLVANVSPQRFAQALYNGVENTAASAPAEGQPALHPAQGRARHLCLPAPLALPGRRCDGGGHAGQGPKRRYLPPLALPRRRRQLAADLRSGEHGSGKGGHPPGHFRPRCGETSRLHCLRLSHQGRIRQRPR